MLLALFAWQVTSGLVLTWRGRTKRSGFVAHFQAFTGVYLALFLIIHVSAVMSGRLAGLDTDFRFAAAGMNVPPFQWFFMPYYFLAAFSLFAHVGCALYWNVPDHIITGRPTMLGAFIVTGLASGTLIVAALSGMLFPLSIPAEYLASFRS